MFGIGKLDKLKPQPWTKVYRIIEKTEKMMCKCGKEISFNGVTSHSRVCPFGWYAKDVLFYKLANLRAGHESVNGAFSHYHKNKEQSDFKNNQYWNLKKKLKTRHFCDNCGKLIYSKNKTCSKKCAYELMSKNHGYLANSQMLKILHKNRQEQGFIYSAWNKGITGDEYISHYQRENETLDEAKKRFTTGLFTKTSIEEKIEKFLIQEKIEYNYSYFLGGRQFDFNIKGKYIIIEADGDYWHGNPNSIYHNQEKQIIKQKDDRIKDSIAKENGNVIIRFWESDIHNNFNWISKIIKIVVEGDQNDIEKALCEIKENYTRGSGQYIRCYSPR